MSYETAVGFQNMLEHGGTFSEDELKLFIYWAAGFRRKKYLQVTYVDRIKAGSYTPEQIRALFDDVKNDIFKR